MELHLDCLGGLAGDMFVACALDAFPEHRAEVLEQVAALRPGFAPDAPLCRIVAWDDGTFAGSRFEVPVAQQGHAHGHQHAHEHEHEHEDDDRSPAHLHDRPHDRAEVLPHQPHQPHQPGSLPGPAPGDDDTSRTAGPAPSHLAWAVIRQRLQQALPAGVLRHALGIFECLAIAEAEVHGVTVDAVEFHEVGAWDSVVDVVAAATLIDRLDARRWSVGALPLGSGRIRTAHGPMPVPPPATALLLRGFATLDDGIAGERVTPTGAAILKYLLPDGQSPARPSHLGAPPRSRVLRRSGVGFGSRRLEGISNCVRLLVFDDGVAAVPSPLQASGPGDDGGVARGMAAISAPSPHRELAVIEFEVDDQSAEELALGLDRLRTHAAVFDVVQSPVFGKKGRIMTSVRLLTSPAALAEVIAACFRETTTIGLRHSVVRGAALPRTFDEVTVDGRAVRVKLVDRPGGVTAKAESDDTLAQETHQARRGIRQEAERLALQRAAAGLNDV